MGASILRDLLAQRGISPLISVEQEDGRYVTSHCAEQRWTESRSPLWGDQMEMNRLFVFIRSDPPGGWKIGPSSVWFWWRGSDWIAAGVSGHVTTDIVAP